MNGMKKMLLTLLQKIFFRNIPLKMLFKNYSLKNDYLKTYLILIISTLTFQFALSSSVEDKVRNLMNLNDYISNDYVNAIENGSVIDELEYEEMIDFSSALQDLYKQLQSEVENPDFDKLPPLLDSLQHLIDEKASIVQIKAVTSDIRNLLNSLEIVQTAPNHWPDIANGKKLYELNCSNCHGKLGLGDGEMAESSVPEPTNFHETNYLTGFHIYNTILLGIEGTSMVAQPHLSDDEKWDIAFYVQTLVLQEVDFDKSVNYFKNALERVTLKDVATKTNSELLSVLPNEKLLYAVRFHQTKNGSYEGILLTKSLLNQAVELYESGKYDEANSMALKAYFEGFEPVERTIIVKQPKVVQNVESEMLALRSLLSSPNQLEAVLDRKNNIELYLDAIDLDGATSHNFWFSLFATLSILIREGLEALLIIVAILSALRAMKSEEAIKYVHFGWVSALVLGIASYLLVEKVIELGAYNREIIEGLGALLAVVILLSVGYWLHDKSNAQRWQQYVKGKIQKNLNKGSYIGIGILAFVVVFREAFESVVFLSALTAGGETAAKNGVAVGFVISLLFIIVLAVFIIKFSKKIPVHHVFKISSILIIILAIILSGKGIKELQEAGVVGVKILPFNLHIDFLGIYPTIQTFGAQIFVFLIAMGLIYINRKKLKHSN